VWDPPANKDSFLIPSLASLRRYDKGSSFSRIPTISALRPCPSYLLPLCCVFADLSPFWRVVPLRTLERLPVRFVFRAGCLCWNVAGMIDSRLTRSLSLLNYSFQNLSSDLKTAPPFPSQCTLPDSSCHSVIPKKLTSQLLF